MPKPKSARRNPMRNLTGTPEYQCPRCTDKHGLQAGWHPIENFPVGTDGRTLRNCKQCHRPQKKRSQDTAHARPKSAAQKMGVDVQDYLHPRRYYQPVNAYERVGEPFAEVVMPKKWSPQ